jgi:predicted ATPase
LRAAPRDIRDVIGESGVSEWIWKGQSRAAASIEVIIKLPWDLPTVRHRLAFRVEQQSFRLDEEIIEPVEPKLVLPPLDFYYRYRRQRELPTIVDVKGQKRSLVPEAIQLDQSILAQRRDPDTYPEISYLIGDYEQIRLYREWTFGHAAVFRAPQKADQRNNRLEEDFSNLGLFLNRLRRNPKAKHAMLAGLRDLYEGLTDFDVTIEGGTVQVFFTEGDFAIPATRLSDGTLRYLCLLAILCDPEPPSLIAIEEPELGLHPDILPKVADLLIEASTRTQLIVTTHSDILVDAMTEQPEAIVVCEKHSGQTVMRRLDQKSLAHWLKNYRLGQLWTRGELGGTRW